MITLTKTRLQDGVWEGVLKREDTDAMPSLRVTYLEQTLSDVQSEKISDYELALRIEIPAAVINDGIQTILVINDQTGDTLGTIPLIAGDALSADLTAEIGLLRAELDMLKRAFRRHCVETM